MKYLHHHHREAEQGTCALCLPPVPRGAVLEGKHKLLATAGDQLHTEQQHFRQNGVADWLWHYPRRYKQDCPLILFTFVQTFNSL